MVNVLSIEQLPGAVIQSFIAGSPWAFNIDASAGSLAITSPELILIDISSQVPVLASGPAPTVASKVVSVAFSASQTAALNTRLRGTRSYAFSVRALVGGQGPYELAGGELHVKPRGSTGTSTATTLTLPSLTVGAVTIPLTITLGGVGVAGAVAISAIPSLPGAVTVQAALEAIQASRALDSSRFGPGKFFVDNYLWTLYGVTQAAATGAQILAAHDAAIAAAVAVGGGEVCFTPGCTYTVPGTFKIKSNITWNCEGATLKKANGSNGVPLIVNEDWANGNSFITLKTAGSVWDFNGRQSSNSGTPAYGNLGDCVHFQNVSQFAMYNAPLVKDASKFAICIGHASEIRVDGAFFDTRSDGFHGYGPMKRAKFGTFSGRTGDDFFALTISDYAAQIANLTANGESTTLGDFKDITIDALLIDNSAVPTGGGTTGSGFALLGNSGSYSFDRIKVGVIEGTTKQAVRITTDATLTNTQVGTVTIGKVATVGIGDANSQISIAPTAANAITIDEISGDYGTSSLVSVSGGTTKTLNVGAFTATNATTGILIHIAAGSILDVLNLANVTAILGAAGRLIQHNSATLTRVNVSNFDISSSTTGWGMNVETTSAGVRARWANGSFRGLTKPLAHMGGTTVHMLDNVEFDTNVMFCESQNAANVRVLGGNVRYVGSGSADIYKYNTSVFSCSGVQLRVDNTKIDTAQSVRGDMFLNTNASGLALGVAQYNGTAFVAIM